MTKIIFSKKSEKDLEEIYNFIATDSIFYAKKTIDSILDSIYSLLKFKEMGVQYNKSQKYKNIRKISYKNYSIFYLNKEECVYIITILHQSRDSNV